MSRFTLLVAVVIVAIFAVLSVQSGPSADLKAFHNGSPEELLLARTISENHFQQRLSEYGISSTHDLKVSRVFVDELSMAHTRVQQTFEGIPVFGAEAIVHLNSDGSLFTVTDNLARNVQVNARPDLSSPEAINIAVANYGCEHCLTAVPESDLWVLRAQEQDRLVYRVQLRREDGTAETAMPVYFIDAHSGEMIWTYNNLQTATGTGASLYSGTVNINTVLNSSTSTYYLEDTARKMGTFDFRNGISDVYPFIDANNTWDSTTQRAAVDAHFGAAAVYDYYKNVHGRIGIDGNGGPDGHTSFDGVTKLISSRVHYGKSFNNAFWNGTHLTYGDGDGINYSPFVALDICGHEFTHGVTEKTAGLIYSDEPGALNESMSDVFGALAERYVRGESSKTWKIGEDAYTPGTAGDAVRYMDNPHMAKDFGFTVDDDPDHYSERYIGYQDNGGVHINSGIANKAFYLLAVGGTHHKGGSMTGIGADAAGKIWYKALTTYMTSSTNFDGARTATINAANAIYGANSTQSEAVARAWCLVGVGSCPVDLITNGGFEGNASPWTFTGNSFFSTGSYPHSGTGYAVVGGVNLALGQVEQVITIPSTATTANLTFWLNVTSSETTTSQSDLLYVEVASVSGFVLSRIATYSNLNQADAGSYTMRGPFNLSAFKGQSIKLKFRTMTNLSSITTFRIDDVAVKSY